MAIPPVPEKGPPQLPKPGAAKSPSKRPLDDKTEEVASKKIGKSKAPGFKKSLTINVAGSEPKPPGELVPEKEIEQIGEQEIREAMTKIEVGKVPSLFNNYMEKEVFFQSQHPNASIEFSSIAVGVTETEMVSVDKQPVYILKKVSLPKEAFPVLQEKLKECKKENLQHTLENILIKNIPDEFGYKKPYYLAAQREYLAYIIGESLGVPKTRLLCDNKGMYSLHNYQQNIGNVGTIDILNKQDSIDVQSLQNIAILDFLTENQDRNPGNILAVKENENLIRLIPIDHALSFQQATSKESFTQWIVRPPYWIECETIVQQELTFQTRSWIYTFSAEEAIRKAETMIVIEESVKNQLKINVELLRNIINSVSNISLYSVYDKWINHFMDQRK